MWMPKRFRRQLEQVQADASGRLAAARDAAAHAEQAQAVSEPIAARSRELSDSNSIALIIADSLRLKPPPGRYDH